MFRKDENFRNRTAAMRARLEVKGKANFQMDSNAECNRLRSVAYAWARSNGHKVETRRTPKGLSIRVVQ